MIIGVSDANRLFHPIAFAITSHTTENALVRFATDVKNALTAHLGRPIHNMTDFHSSDASSPEFNGLAVFGETATHLMCYFHVMKAVKEKASRYGIADEIMADVKGNRIFFVTIIALDLHWSRDETEFNRKLDAHTQKWRNKGAAAFATYFKNQWIDGRFCKWRLFDSSPGVAGTNNPIENFNNTFKRCFTKRRRSHVASIIAVLVKTLYLLPLVADGKRHVVYCFTPYRNIAICVKD